MVLDVHEGLYGLLSNVPLNRSHVLMNKPGYCESQPRCTLTMPICPSISLTRPKHKNNEFSTRIESVLVIRDMHSKNNEPDQS